jgi:hypothetical protein
MGSFLLHGKKNPSCTQNRAVPTHHRTPDAPRWRSRLALGVGEGQKQPRCIDSPVWRRGDVCQMRRQWGHFYYTEKSTPPAHRTGLFRPTTALPTPPVGVPASPWVWAKARSNLGALIRLCRDGAMSNEATMGSFLLHGKKHPTCTQNRAVPTHHRTPDAPRWRSRLALGVGEGQKQTRCIDSPVRRRGDVK